MLRFRNVNRVGCLYKNPCFKIRLAVHLLTAKSASVFRHRPEVTVTMRESLDEIYSALVLAGLVVLTLLFRTAKLKSTYYEVTADRIEWARGIFNRKVDNLDLFRVIDLQLRRTLLDGIFGVGTVTLFATDKTDPQFTFEKVRRPRKLYDILKKASLEADKQQDVIHLE